MTVVDNRREHSLVPIQGEPRLSSLIGARRGWFAVLSTEANLERPLAGAVIWDPTQPLHRHQVVLLTAARPSRAELTEAVLAGQRAEAAAIVLRDGCLPADAEVTAAGIPVLAVHAEVGWEELGALVRSLVSRHRLGVPESVPTASGLYELAESAALALAGAVVLTDAALRVLAFGCEGGLEETTGEPVLARRGPGEELAAVRKLHGIAWIGHRLVAPIEVANRTVGYVLLTPGPDTPDCAERVLGDVAAAAAAWFPDAGVDAEDEVRAELLRGLLAGKGSLEALTERLPARCPAWYLLALGSFGAEAAFPPERESPLARCARMLNPETITVIHDSVAYVLFTGAGDPGAFAEQLRGRAARLSGVPVVACLTAALTATEEVRAEREPLRHAVAVLAARRTPATASLAELRPHILIAELAGLVTEHPGLLSGPVDLLRRDGSRRGAEYLDTLLSWFDAACDVTRAAAALRVHRNTFRYRLQRIEKLCALDLEDAVQRFTLELQVRLLVLRGGW
ncbi:PucR family transcriptional regulator [Sciscionella sediminilitoris]|uniref:PucR family transcriptional regulator n=1 Tax=Sciscionella sediminilitoris TaxID=1445613 RepID=UPI0004DECF90|nr:PucR family transcriptional regulator [Sciscionella sp. SE31]